ncbi:MAG: aromatic amino acid lyase [Nitrososphaerota archaeon]|nr:aromatic amino acid lyase [Nitrososphaerota archaeon]MDG6942328.1 aromatic amino acid lyase [Nitrososphaerota archaeon]MDG6942794.1 aromatic amino acid lyase [Nitrososphaerota archaeon]MDG6948581.1 aromatic amino acid lyase [Nitrososphaerota archaeon]MDG6950507.1 aromatic amino acid lyase [Nitrososphaerota archaeon]
MAVVVDGHSLTLRSAMDVAEGGALVKVSPGSLKRLERFRALLEQKLASGEVVYGVNTGFGSLANEVVSSENLEELQLNLIRSHASGVGSPLPLGVVRAAMLIRLNSLLNGNSAVRRAVVELIVGLLNMGVTPFVPEFGSLGASGDLTPSAHMALTLVGEGKAFHNGRLTDSSSALNASGLKPIPLRAKEGLSLINGTAFTTALGGVAVHKGRTLLGAANSALAMTAEALGGCSQAFDERLVGIKLDPGQRSVAGELRTLLKGSRRMRAEPVPQDPYSIRCAPQVHGSLVDALEFAEEIVVNEMNSVSDNPVLLEDGEVLHGGNFHAQPVAMSLDLLSLALSYLGVISLARIHYLLSKTPPGKKYMAGKPGLESGLMLLEYTATALNADNAKNIYPESSYPSNVSGGIEDHASHGVNAGVKALQVATNVSRVLAVELICASNVLGSDTGGLSEHTKKVSRFVRSFSPLLRGDRSQGSEIETLAGEMMAGRLP